MNILKHTQFGDTITSYDVLKSLAIVLMIIDHIGAFFLPEVEVLRVLGRLCVPIWFFLIGYAHSRHIPASWLVGALILIGTTWLFEERFFYLSILATMIFCRLTLDFFAPLFLKNLPLFAAGSVLCTILAFHTIAFTDYGSLAIPLVMFGLVVRRGGATLGHVIVIYLIFLVSQFFMFGFSLPATWGLMALLPLPLWLCWRFRPETLAQRPDYLRLPLQFMGRRTLEIYVVHMALFQLLTSPVF